MDERPLKYLVGKLKYNATCDSTVYNSIDPINGACAMQFEA